MDKFIARGEQRKARLNPDKVKGRRKSPDVPFHMWPLKDQIAYHDDATPAEKFDRKWDSYLKWLNAVEKASGMYSITFSDVCSPHKKRIQELFADKQQPAVAARILQKENILH